MRLSIPGQNRTIASEVEPRARLLRAAVAELAPSFGAGLSDAYLGVFSPRWSAIVTGGAPERLRERAAWALVQAWLIGRLSGDLAATAGLADGESWFTGASRPGPWSLTFLASSEAIARANQSLARLAVDDAVRDLLPYLLEPHGPGTRLSVMRDASTAVDRAKKKASGVFYTPADVAEFMVAEALAPSVIGRGNLRILDPACGTGVFLLACLRFAKRSIEMHSPLAWASNVLHGFDISEQATEATAFALLGECLDDVRTRRISPWAAWHVMRLNLVAVDSLTVRRGGSTEGDFGARSTIRASLLRPGASPPLPVIAPSPAHIGVEEYLLRTPSRRTVGEVFGGSVEAFDVVVGNPPYASLGPRRDLTLLGTEFESLAGRPALASHDHYPLFVELMWRLGTAQATGAMVVPLSLGCSTVRQLADCRQAIERAGGRWRFAFFDRQPHALFGEDVKTRSAIVLRDPALSRMVPFAFETTRLTKWTSRTRSDLFANLRFTPLRCASIAAGVPKLEGEAQAAAFEILSRRRAKLHRSTRSIESAMLDEVAAARDNRTCVYVASTAYNFLNVFRSLTGGNALGAPFSESPVLALHFDSNDSADAAFSLLTSRLAFWYWHVNGDGFHVTRRFIENLPFELPAEGSPEREALARLGANAWSAIRDTPVVSLNRGRRTLGYRPFGAAVIRDAIDRLLVAEAGLPAKFHDEVRTFERKTAIVDDGDERRLRLRLRSYYESEEVA